MEHSKLTKDHAETLQDLASSQKECAKIGDQRDSKDNENKRVVAENTKLSIELADLKKALAW